MLILFHYLSILFFHILQKRKCQKYLENVQDNFEIESLDSGITTVEDLEYTIKFDPPVYLQRYAAVYETIIDERWRTKITKLCDFGCAEFGLFVFIKRLNKLTKILFVDIEEETLKESVRRIHPLTIEYLKRREEPLTVSVFAGSVGDPDYRILNTDVVTAIELIEHLYPDVLEAFPYNVFNYIEPKLVIITTPNADFNPLFSSEPSRFRHIDHKFEWTREQFENWANNIVIRFPDYIVNFSGLGEGPKGTAHFGYCSQMALFIRKDVLDEKYMLKKYLTSCLCFNDSSCKSTEHMTFSCKCVCPLCMPKTSYGICTYYSYSKHIIEYEIGGIEQNPPLNIFYKPIEKIEYPFESDGRTEEEKMMDEIRYRINTFGQPNSRFYVEDRKRAEIPLKDLLYGNNIGSITESELGNILAKHDYQIEKCVIQETNELETCVIFIPLMDNISSSDPSDLDTNSGYYQSVNESLSDWDEVQQDQKEIEASSSNKGPISSLDVGKGYSLVTSHASVKSELSHQVAYSSFLLELEEAFEAIQQPNYVFEEILLELVDSQLSIDQKPLLDKSLSAELLKQEFDKYNAEAKEKKTAKKKAIYTEEKFLCKYRHPLVISSIYIMTALKEFVTSYYCRNTKYPTTAERINYRRNTLSRLIHDKDIMLFWKTVKDVYNKEHERIWNGLETGIKKYHELLTQRKALCEEILDLRKKNHQLKSLLNVYMSHKPDLISPCKLELDVIPKSNGELRI